MLFPLPSPLSPFRQYVDDVLIDAPFVITQEMIASLRIDVVVKGSFDHYRGPTSLAEADPANTVADASSSSSAERDDEVAAVENEVVGEEGEEEDDMYALPRKLRMLRTVKSSTDFSVLDFVDRIQDQRDKFATK